VGAEIQVKFDGILTLQKVLEAKMKKAEPESVLSAQAAAAERMRALMEALPRPRRRGVMLGGFAYEQDKNNLETYFGWGRKGFYGRFVESGHRVGGYVAKRMPKGSTVRARPHLRPAFEAHRQELIEAMLARLEGG